MVKRKKKTILADRISGCEGTAFAFSVCVRVIELGNKRVKFKFPFWAFSAPFRTNQGTEWISNQGYTKESLRILESIKKPSGLDYFRRIKTQITKEEIILEKAAQKLRPRLSFLSDRELASAYEKFVRQYSYYYGLGIVTFLYEGILSERLMRSLLARYPAATDALPYLFKNSYQSFMLKSEQTLARIKSVRNVEPRQRLIEKYKKDFFYIRTNYWHGPRVDSKFVLERVKDLKPAEKSFVSRSRLKLMPWEKQVIELLKINEAIRDKRKQINLIGSYMMFRFIDELAKRRKIKVSLAKRAFWFEFGDLLLNTKKILPRLMKRQGFCAGYDQGRSFYLDYLAIKDRSGLTAGSQEVSGTPAAPGSCKGYVRLVMTGRDFENFKKGEILVTTMTRPEFLPVMKKASAIITDEGGLTCHAAIIAREIKIPCVIGTKNATRLLHNRDLVEVDATRGIIKILKK